MSQVSHPHDVTMRALRIAVFYALGAGLWILLSDSLVGWIFPVSAERIQLASTLKGLFFVVVTAGLLYFVIVRLFSAETASIEKVGAGETAGVGASWRWWLVFMILGAGFALLAGRTITENHAQHRTHQGNQLEAVARLKVAQIEQWLDDHRQKARLIQQAPIYQDVLQQWLEKRDSRHEARLRNTLELARTTLGYDSTLIVNARGEILLQAGGAGHVVGPDLKASIDRALAENRLTATNLYRMDQPPPAHVHLDIVVPLPPPRHLIRAQLAVVLRLNLSDTLYRIVESWPTDSATAETILFRRDGTYIQVLNRPRHQDTGPLALRLPINVPDLSMAQALDAAYAPGSLIEGVDYRGVRTIAVARPLAGTDWWLLAEMDEAEMLAAASREALIIGLISLMAWAVGVVFIIVLMQRRALRAQAQLQQAQEEKLQAEQARHRSDVRLEALIDPHLDALFVHDFNGRFVDVNQHACDSLGYTRDELLALKLTDIEDSLRLEQAQQQWACFEAGRVVTFQGRHRRKDGTTFPVEVRVGLVVEGNERYYIGMARDISERLRIEAELKKLSLAIEQSPESVVITDTEARIEYVNRAFEQNTGYRRAEVIGQNPRVLQSGKTPRATFEDMWATLLSGRTWKGQFENRRKDGTELSEFIVVAPLRQADGKVTHYVAVKEDISEKKRIAHELDDYRHHLEELVAHRTAELEAARQQAEAANQAKSAFLANMSHEIRTPMNAIVGLAHLLQRDEAAPEQRARLEKIVSSAHHLLAMISDILDFSKIEAGKLALEPIDFDLNQLMGLVADQVAEEIDAVGVQLVVDVEPVLAAGPRLHGDMNRLHQALHNLARNAVKFTRQGYITLRVRRQEQDASGQLLRFEVEDIGIGIAPADRLKLFAVFEQADNTTTRQYGGTGLGLALTRRLAQLLGGSIGVESTVGKGSLFWFTARVGVVGEGAATEHAMPPQSVVAEAPDEQFDSVRAGLNAIDGLAVETGLRNLNHHFNRYVQMLAHFLQTHRQDGAVLERLLKVGDRETALRQVHSLKGVAATLGAHALAESAASLEHQLREQAENALVAEALRVLETSLTTLIAGLDEAMAPTQVPPPHPTTAARVDLQAGLNELEILLGRDDPAANRVYATLAPQLKTLAGDQFERLELAMANYQYPAALEMVRALRAMQP